MGAALRIKQLRQALADANAKMQAITDLCSKETRARTDEERTEFEALEKSFDTNKVELDSVKRQAEREREIASEPPIEDGNAEAAARAQKQAEAAAGGQSPDAFASFGEQIRAVIRAGVPNGPVDPRLMKAAATGLNEGVGSDGGFFVDQQRIVGIRERMYESGQLLNRVNKQPIGEGFNGIKLLGIDETSRADGSRYGGIRVYWTAEAGEKLPSKPKFREINLRLKKVAGLVYLTDELLEDAVALEGLINRILPLELSFAVEDAIIFGTGAGMPLGFLNSGAAITVARTTPGAVVYQDIMNMWSRMWAPSRNTAVWLIDQSIESNLYGMSLAVGVGGVPVYMPAGGISGQPFTTLFGRPVIPYEHGSALGTAGDIILADPSQYTLIDKGGIKSASSMHVRFIYDETVLRFVYRVDGAPEWNSALTPKSGGSTLSPFVVLGT